MFKGLKMENQKKCTLKERRQVARILAARDNESRACERHLNIAANMTDAEIIQFLNDEERKMGADVVEVLNPESVEEIKPGTAAPGYYDLFDSLIASYMAANSWDGEKISPLQWAACCMSVGRFVRSRSLFRKEQVNCIATNNINELNIDEIAQAGAAYLELCFKYNKTPLICDFCEVVAITRAAFYNLKDSNRLTPGGVDIYKTIEQQQADGLRRIAIDGKRSPVGAIFLLKADHGLVEATKVQHEYIKNDGSAAKLPFFSSDPLEIEENNAK